MGSLGNNDLMVRGSVEDSERLGMRAAVAVVRGLRLVLSGHLGAAIGVHQSHLPQAPGLFLLVGGLKVGWMVVAGWALQVVVGCQASTS